VKAAIVIPVHNAWPFTRACLHSIDGVSSLLPTTVVVDNASTDETSRELRAEAMDRLGAVLQLGENRGFAGGTNAGAALALERFEPDVLILLNNDTIAHEGSLEALASAAMRGGIAGGLLVYPGPRCLIQHAGMAGRNLAHLYRMKPARGTQGAWRRKDLQYVTGAAMAVRVDLWRALRGLDEGYANGYEDVDLCVRARTKYNARVIYEPEAGFVHYEGQTKGRHAKETENRDRFYGRWVDQLVDDRQRIEKEDRTCSPPPEMPLWLAAGQ